MEQLLLEAERGPDAPTGNSGRAGGAHDLEFDRTPRVAGLDDVHVDQRPEALRVARDPRLHLAEGERLVPKGERRHLFGDRRLCRRTDLEIDDLSCRIGVEGDLFAPDDRCLPHLEEVVAELPEQEDSRADVERTVGFSVANDELPVRRRTCDRGLRRGHPFPPDVQVADQPQHVSARHGALRMEVPVGEESHESVTEEHRYLCAVSFGDFARIREREMVRDVGVREERVGLTRAVKQLGEHHREILAPHQVGRIGGEGSARPGRYLVDPALQLDLHRRGVEPVVAESVGGEDETVDGESGCQADHLQVPFVMRLDELPCALDGEGFEVASAVERALDALEVRQVEFEHVARILGAASTGRCVERVDGFTGMRRDDAGSLADRARSHRGLGGDSAVHL